MDKSNCIENVIRCIKVIIVLKLVMVTSTPISLCSLSKICCVDRGITEIGSLPKDNLCTAIATYSKNKETTVDDIRKLRDNLPLVYIVNDWDYDEMKKKLSSETVNKFYEYLSDIITDQNINVVLFDHLYPSEKEELNSNLQNNIYALIKKMKEDHPDTLFGLVLSHNKHIMENAFNLNQLNNIVDIFLAKTYSYLQCIYRYHQSEMAMTSPVEDMRKTLRELTSIGYDMSKMVLTVRIIVNSVLTGKYAKADNDESYTSLCSSHPSKRRKFCKESLSNFYQKGLLVFSNKMVGCLIQSVDRDDYNNECQCGNNPVLNCISAGINGGPDPIDITTCGNFGLIPTDQD